MAAHQPPPSEEEENSQEQAPPTYEDKLADKMQEGGFSGEQQTTIQAALALLFGASTHAIEIKQSLDLLRGEIDVNKLVTDPKYKAQIERAVQLTNRYSKFVKKGDLVEKVPKVEKVIKRTTACHNKLLAEKSSMLLNDNLYLRRLQSAYNLDDKQLQAIKYSAWAKIQENPSLSIKDALRIEAENFSLKQVTKEVDNENRGKKLTKSEKKAQVEKKLTEKHIAFETSLTTTDAKTGEVKSYADYENKRVDEIIKKQVEENKQILATEISPKTSPVPQATIPTPSSATSTTPSKPQVSIGWGGRIRGYLQTRFNIRLPVLNLSIGQQWLSGFVGRFAFLQGARLTMRNLAAFSLVSLRGALSGTALRSLIRPAFHLGKAVVGGGLAGVSLGTSLLITAALTLAEKLPLIGGVIQGAEKFIMIILLLAIGIPIAILLVGGGVFMATLTTKPTFLRATNNSVLSWSEFSKQNLIISSPNQLSWEQFEKNNLNPAKHYLSLDTNGHDDVKK